MTLCVCFTVAHRKSQSSCYLAHPTREDALAQQQDTGQRLFRLFAITLMVIGLTWGGVPLLKNAFFPVEKNRGV